MSGTRCGIPFLDGLNQYTQIWTAPRNPAFTHGRINWRETPDAHVIKADLPGMRKEVKVEVEDGRILQINCERDKEQEEKTDTWHRVGRSSRKFLLRFRLLENAKTEQVKAIMEYGVLNAVLPKAEGKKPQVKAIAISG